MCEIKNHPNFAIGMAATQKKLTSKKNITYSKRITLSTNMDPVQIQLVYQTDKQFAGRLDLTTA